MFYRFARALLIPVFLLFYNYRITGRENIPKDGAYIVCANHVSAVDPILVGISIPKRMYFMAKVELFRNRLLRALMNGLGAFPIKRGEADIKSIKTSLKLLNSGKSLLFFRREQGRKVMKLLLSPVLQCLQ